MIIGFVIWSVVALSFFGIGIYSRKSKNAAGFFTFVNPPDVKDIKKYNKAVSDLWFVSAVLLEVIGLPFLFFPQNSPVFLFIIFPVIILIIIMMVVYMRIEAKYKK